MTLKNKNSKKNTTFVLGFPVDRPELEEARSEKKSQKGISLLIAILSISIMITLMSELIVSTSVNVELAMLTRNKIKSNSIVRRITNNIRTVHATKLNTYSTHRHYTVIQQQQRIIENDNSDSKHSEKRNAISGR